MTDATPAHDVDDDDLDIDLDDDLDDDLGGDLLASDEDDFVTPGTVYLHIGSYKSGTSFVQSVLVRNRELLATEGLFYPVGTRAGAQVRAIRDVLGIKGPRPDDGAWDDIRHQINVAAEPRALISMEFLSLATPEQVLKIVDDLKPHQVEVILTARDLARVLPSAWQSMIKQGRGWTFTEFLRSSTKLELVDPSSEDQTPTSEADPDAGRRFWLHQDILQLVRNWLPAVGAEHFHLVTLPRSGAPPSTLWERFSEVVGVTPGIYNIEQDKDSNFSLSFSDSELMRRVNLILRPQLERFPFKWWATRYFANQVLREATGAVAGDDRVLVPPEAHQWAVEESRRLVDELKAFDMHVVGDLEELVPLAYDPAVAKGRTEPLTVYPQRAVEIFAIVIKRLATVDAAATSRLNRENKQRGKRKGGRKFIQPDEDIEMFDEGGFE